MYDSAGNKIREGLPFEDDGDFGEYQEPVWNNGDGIHLYVEKEYDALGRVINQTNTDATIISMYFGGNKQKIVDEAANQSVITTNGFGKTIDIENALSYHTTYSYSDPLGTFTNITNAASQVTKKYTDAFGNTRVIETVDSGIQRNLMYDRNGNLVLSGSNCSVTWSSPWEIGSGCGIVFGFTYDTINRLKKVDADNDQVYETNYTYDTYTGTGCPLYYSNINYSKGKQTFVKDVFNKTTVYSQCTYYDARGRVEKEVTTQDGDTYIIDYRYDDAGNLIQQTLPDDNLVAYDYDIAGRLREVNVNTIVYNPSFEIGLEGWDCNNDYEVTSDEAVFGAYALQQTPTVSNHLCKGSLLPADYEAEYTICGYFRKEEGSEETAQTYLGYEGYDENGTAVTDCYNYPPELSNVNVSDEWMLYCGNFNLSSDPDCDEDTTQMKVRLILNYNTNDEDAIVFGDGIQLYEGEDEKVLSLNSYAYRFDGLVGEAIQGNNVKTAFDYTQRKWLESQEISRGSRLFARHYNYDDVGNIVAMHNSTTETNLLATYDFDKIYQLISVEDNAYYGRSSEYTYDTVGNRQAENDEEYEYYSGSNRLETFNDSVDFTYDELGNMLTKIKGSTTFAYTYNAKNMLSSFLTNDTVQGSYEHDDLNRRIVKESTITGVQTTYVYSGNILVQEVRECINMSWAYNISKGVCSLQ